MPALAAPSRVTTIMITIMAAMITTTTVTPRST